MQNIGAGILKFAEQLPQFDSRAVLIALIAGWVTGWLWYLLVDRAWRAATKGIESDVQVMPRTQIRAAIAQVIMTVMLAIIIERFEGTSVVTGTKIAIMMWFGFVMTTMMVNHSHLGAKLSLTFIDGIHWFLVLVVMGAILGAFGSLNTAERSSQETSTPPVVEKVTPVEPASTETTQQPSEAETAEPETTPDAAPKRSIDTQAPENQPETPDADQPETTPAETITEETPASGE